MIEFNYLQTELSAEKHLLLSADHKLYEILEDGEHHSFDDYVDPIYRDSFTKNLSNADGTWFPARLLLKTGSVLFYIHAKKIDSSNSIRLYLVSIDHLLKDREHLLEIVTTMHAQMSLYDDIFFDYNPENFTLSLHNTQAADFDAGTYSVDKAEAILCQKVSPDMQEHVKSFIRQIKTKPGRFATTIEGNLINSDNSITSTLLEASYALMPSGKEKVVGHIHPISKNSGGIAPSLKRDFLTGLVDKADITRIAQERIDQKKLEGTTLAILDLDYFKSINDTFGHQFGDTVLKKVAEIISTEMGNYGIAGRFGGDEFFVLLYNTDSEEKLRRILRGIKSRVGATFPDKGMDKDNPISVSIGTAVFPKDADNYDDLFMVADHCLYLAKEKGRNRYVIYSQAKHGTIDSIRLSHQSGNKINDRDISCGDVIVKMFDMVLHGGNNSLEDFMKEFAQTFGLQNVHLYVGGPFKYRYSAGRDVINDQAAITMVEEVLNSDAKDKFFTLGDFVLVNNLDTLPPHFYGIKSFLIKRGVYSLIILRFFDKDGRECILIISSVGKVTEWNRSHFKYYRVFTDLLSLLSLNQAK